MEHASDQAIKRPLTSDAGSIVSACPLGGHLQEEHHQAQQNRADKGCGRPSGEVDGEEGKHHQAQNPSDGEQSADNYPWLGPGNWVFGIGRPKVVFWFSGTEVAGTTLTEILGNRTPWLWPCCSAPVVGSILASVAHMTKTIGSRR